MTLDEMCQTAARLSDRFDEFEKTTDESGSEVYQDDALHYFNVFRDAINEAYYAVARKRYAPYKYYTLTVPSDKEVDLSVVTPNVYDILNLLNAERTRAIKFTFIEKELIYVDGANAGDEVVLYYHYIPDKLTEYSDEPIFPDIIVDPMVYITLAVARMWQSEKKSTQYSIWMAEYHQAIREVATDMRGKRAKRIPRPLFR